MTFSYTIYGSEGDQFATSATQILPLGTRMVMRDGRAYRYSQASSSAIQAGLLIRAATQVGNTTMAHVLAEGSAANATSILINATGATGPLSAGDLDEGMIVFSATGATGQGESHLIYRMGSTDSAGTVDSASKSYAWTTATGTFVTLHLYPNDKLRNAWATSTGTVLVMQNKYRDVTPTSIAIGSGGAVVGVSNVHVAGNYYFWAQTWGPCPVEFSTSAASGNAVGLKVAASTGANSTGNVGLAVSTQQLTPTATSEAGMANPAVGTIITCCATTFMAIIDLNIAP